MELSEIRVLLVGYGSIAQAASLYLVKAGFRRFTIADSGTFAACDAASDLLFTEAKTGKKRSAAGKAFLPLYADGVTVEVCEELSPEALRQLLRENDLCIDAACDDSLSLSLEKAAALEKKCVIFGRTVLDKALCLLYGPGSLLLTGFLEKNSPLPSRTDMAGTAAAAGILISAAAERCARGEDSAIKNRLLFADTGSAKVTVHDAGAFLLEKRKIRLSVEQMMKNSEMTVPEDVTVNDLIRHFDLAEIYCMKNGRYVPEADYDKPVFEDGDRVVFTVSVILD